MKEPEVNEKELRVFATWIGVFLGVILCIVIKLLSMFNLL